MPDQSSLKTQQCYERAVEARRLAADATNGLDHSELRQTEQRWLRLAASCEHAEKLSRLLDETCEWLRQEMVAPRGVPSSVPDLEPGATSRAHPRCAACAVPMWLVSVDPHPGGVQKTWLFECKKCRATLALSQRAALPADHRQFRIAAKPVPVMPRGPTLAECFNEKGGYGTAATRI
jgi:hypothetical protein